MDHAEDDVEFRMVAVRELTEWERKKVAEVRVDDKDDTS